jgi:hypothetical protein
MAWYSGWEYLILFMVVFFLLIIIVVWWSYRKVRVIVFPYGDPRAIIDNLGRMAPTKGWSVRPEGGKGRVLLFKKSVGTILYLRPLGDGTVAVDSEVTASRFGFIRSSSVRRFGAFWAIYLHFASRRFVKREVRPFLYHNMRALIGQRSKGRTGVKGGRGKGKREGRRPRRR